MESGERKCQTACKERRKSIKLLTAAAAATLATAATAAAATTTTTTVAQLVADTKNLLKGLSSRAN